MKQSDYEKLSTPPRQKTSVAIIGLDRSTPDDIVKDGACEELYNMRYKDNAWRPVHPHKEKGGYSPSTSLGTKKIVYKHPASADNKYIIEHAVVGSKQVYRYAEVDITTNEEVNIATFNEQQKVSHFGNILYFGNFAYRYSNGKYTPYIIPNVTPLVESTFSFGETVSPIIPWLFQVDTEVTLPNSIAGGSHLFKDTWYEVLSTTGKNLYESILLRLPSETKIKFAFKLADIEENGTITPINSPTYSSGHWMGEHAMFAILRMRDGTYLKPSPLSIGITRNDFTDYEINRNDIMHYFSDGTTSYQPRKTQEIYITCPWYTPSRLGTMTDYGSSPFTYAIEDIIVSIPDDIDTDVVESIALYSTRVFGTLDLSKVSSINETVRDTPRFLFSDNDMLKSTFYLIAEKTLNECDRVNGKIYFSTRIDSAAIENIPSRAVYEPSIVSTLNYMGSLDYNNRLHIYDITQDFEELLSIQDIIYPSTSSGETTRLGLDVATSLYDIIRWTPKVNGANIKDVHSLVLSSHDYRVKEFYALRNELGADPYTLRFIASRSEANNIAYYINPSTGFCKYPPISLGKLEDHVTSAIYSAEFTPLHEPNRLQVSSANNPFSLPFGNSYSIGSANNRIIALQSAAIEMSDAKFGEMPLYAFTTEGIFALQAGSETLYSNVIPINYDKIINPNTLAINGAIVYITEKGVHLLTNEGSAIISGPIHGRDGMPPLDFLRSCKIIYPKQYNEIVLHNEQDIKAYVYNIDSKYWSTRKLTGYKINTDELINGSTILDLGNEDESKALSARITTRPIKLGNVEFKRLETIIPRMSTGDKNNMLALNLSGSVDGTTYAELRKCNVELEAEKVNPIVLRRTPFSAKYFSLFMSLTPAGETFNPSITHIDFEWYIKFRRRMR